MILLSSGKLPFDFDFCVNKKPIENRILLGTRKVKTFLSDIILENGTLFTWVFCLLKYEFSPSRESISSCLGNSTSWAVSLSPGSMDNANTSKNLSSEDDLMVRLQFPVEGVGKKSDGISQTEKAYRKKSAVKKVMMAANVFIL